MKTEEYVCDNYGHNCQQLKDEAEISFKAGIKEVVEWIENNELYWRSVSTTNHDYYIPLSLANTWQAQKKDWGIPTPEVEEER